jgi:hypothetical protein
MTCPPCLLVLAAYAALACGEKPKDKDARKVRVSVVAILASEKSDKVDDKLKAIAAEVRRMRPALKGFTMANLSCKSLSIDAADIFDLIEGQRARVVIEKAADRMDRIQLKVTPPKMGEITYETPCGKFLPILTPIKTKAGEVLIIAIRVQPCNGGK